MCALLNETPYKRKRGVMPNKFNSNLNKNEERLLVSKKKEFSNNDKNINVIEKNEKRLKMSINEK